MSFTIYNLLDSGAFAEAADLLMQQPLGREDLKALSPLGEAFARVDPNHGNDFLNAWQMAFDHPTARESSREAMAQLVGGLTFGPSRKITNILRRKFPESRLSKWDPKVLKNIRRELSRPKFKIPPPADNFYLELVQTAFDATSLPPYASHSRKIFLSGNSNGTAPSFMEIMDHLGEGGYLVYRMDELPDNYLVFDEAWLSMATGDLYALLARGVDDGSLTEIFSVDEDLARANGSSPHHQQPPVRFNPAMRGFDIYEWINGHYDRWDRNPPVGESLQEFTEFLNRNPTLAQFVNDYRPYVTAGDIDYLIKILSNIKGSFENGSFSIPQKTSDHFRNLIVGRLAEIRLRERVLQEYLRVVREINPHAVLVLDQEIFTPEGRIVPDAMIVGVDPQDQKLFFMEYFSLALTDISARYDVKKIRDKTMDRLKQKGAVLVGADGRWEPFDVELTDSFEVIPYAVPKNEQNPLREMATKIIAEAAYALKQYGALPKPVVERPPTRAGHVNAKDVKDYFRQMHWDTVEEAYATGDPVKILVALLRWSSFKLWQGISPGAYAGEDLKEISILGISWNHPIRKLIYDKTNVLQIKNLNKSLKLYQGDLEKLLNLAGLPPESAHRLVQAVYFSIWNWDSYEIAQAIGDFKKQFLHRIRQIAYDLWGGMAPDIVLEEAGVRIDENGMTQRHPLRRLIKQGLPALFDHNESSLTLKNFQEDLVTLLKLGGASQEDAKEFVRRFYYEYWSWDFTPDPAKRNPEEKFLDRFHFAVWNLWGGDPRSIVDTNPFQSVCKEGIPQAHPFHSLIQEGLTQLREISSAKCFLKDYQQDLVVVLMLDGIPEEEAKKLVKNAYYHRFDWEALDEVKKSKDAKKILIAQLREISYQLWGGIPPANAKGQLLNGISREGIARGLSKIHELFAKGPGGLLMKHVGAMTLPKYQAYLLQILKLGGISPADAQKLIDAAYA